MRTNWIYTMFVLALSLFASCSNEVDEAAGNPKTRTVVFRLSVDDAVGSRANTWGDSYGVGEADVPFDTRINLGSLQVVVYDANNGYVGKAKNVLYWSVAGNQDKNPVVDNDGNVTANEEYQFVGDLSHITTMTEGNSYKFMVLANCDDVGSTTNVGTHPFSVDDLEKAIPMWGVKTDELSGSGIQDLGVINLLRAAAKVEVALGELMQDYQLKEVTINRYNTSGYCAPTGWNVVEKTEELDQDACANFHGPASSASLSFTLSQYKNTATVYVPEYNNKATTVDATITVKLLRGVATADTSDDSELTFTDAIKFYGYVDGSPGDSELNIIRNHHYKFTITDVNSGLEIQYAVMDWVKVDDIDLGTYEYPTYHNPLLPSVPTNEQIHITENPEMYYVAEQNGNINETGAFVAYFNMTAPVNKPWTPTLNASPTDYAIRVYKETNLVYSTIEADNNNENTFLVAYEGWYTIKVIPLKSEKVNSEVDLGITYQISENSTPYYLFVNGTSENDIRWPNSGNDPKFIRIKQVSNLQVVQTLNE